MWGWLFFCGVSEFWWIVTVFLVVGHFGNVDWVLCLRRDGFFSVLFLCGVVWIVRLLFFLNKNASYEST